MAEKVPDSPSPTTEKLPVALGLLKPFLRVLHVNDSTDDQVLFQAACRKGNVPLDKPALVGRLQWQPTPGSNR